MPIASFLALRRVDFERDAEYVHVLERQFGGQAGTSGSSSTSRTTCSVVNTGFSPNGVEIIEIQSKDFRFINRNLMPSYLALYIIKC